MLQSRELQSSGHVKDGISEKGVWFGKKETELSGCGIIRTPDLTAQRGGTQVSTASPNKGASCPRGNGETAMSFKDSRYGNGS